RRWEISGLHTVIDYDRENGHLRETREIRRSKLHDSDQRGNQAWGKKGVFVSRMGNLPSTFYTDAKVWKAVVENEEYLVADGGAFNDVFGQLWHRTSCGYVLLP